jgi:RNA polymerase sigma factor (TIGR02999 family)
MNAGQHSPPPSGDVTRLLHRARTGDRAALDEVIPLVYRELRQQAARLLRGERRQLTIQATVLVHETYERLLGCQRIQWQDRMHFFAVSARLMRQILVDFARARRADKRGADATHVTLGQASGELATDAAIVDVLMLDEALTRLEAIEPRQAHVVEMRWLAGLSVQETAEALGVSERTIKSEWQMARAWLSRELGAISAGG